MHITQLGNVKYQSLYDDITTKRKSFHFAVLTMIFDSPIDLRRTDNFTAALRYLIFCFQRTCLIRPVSVVIRIDNNNNIQIGPHRWLPCPRRLLHIIFYRSYYYYRLLLSGRAVCHRVAVCGQSDVSVSYISYFSQYRFFFSSISFNTFSFVSRYVCLTYFLCVLLQFFL